MPQSKPQVSQIPQMEFVMGFAILVGGYWLRALRCGKGPASLGRIVKGGIGLSRKVAFRGVETPHDAALDPADLHPPGPKHSSEV